MTSERFVLTLYCDDIREEVGGKISLIGCYGSELVVSQPAGPVVLPKLCAHVRIVTPIDRPIRRVTIRALVNGEILAEVNAPGSSGTELPAPAITADARTQSVNAMLVFAPFVVGETDGVLRVVVETEEGLIEGNGLRLVVQRPSVGAH